ncbi:MAG: prepilin-type N-terminal cleavage/methylation domain-containing protein [Candidatus Riflebacteria bacterium]|nr:prepilin-type N-terminal cleavage/methylation domain-containing protein [Candidatus Riflebacteria bacterium]
MNRRNGFTLVEILAAFFLLLLFLTPVLFLLQSSTRGITLTTDDIAAHCAANELVEQLLSIPYDEVPTGVFTDARIIDQQLIGSDSSWPFRISVAEKISRQIEICEISKDDRPRCKKIKVSLSMPALPGGSGFRNYSMIVLYAK